MNKPKTIRIVPTTTQRTPNNGWKMLIVDDEQTVIDMTQEVLKAFIFQGKSLQLLCANSYDEAKVLYDENTDIAIAMIDCVMEQNDSGLQLIQYIRNTQKNNTIQLVLRTGQPDFAPEKNMLIDYEINDYLAKTELTSTKLHHRVISYLRNYMMIQRVSFLHQQTHKTAQQVDRIFSTMAHQLTTAVSEVSQHARGLSSTQSKPSDEFFIQGIKEECLKLEALTKNIKHSVLGGDATLLHLHDIITDLMPAFDRLTRPYSPAILLKNDVENDTPAVYINRQRIEDVLLLLVRNAVDHTSRGSITLSSKVDHQYIYLAINDTGFGINTETTENIKAIFKRDSPIKPDSDDHPIDNHLTNSHKDNDLYNNFSIINTIMNSHYGHIDVESEINKGSTFTLCLPYYQYYS
ncbi:Response regulator [gamma proteobacterium IMCC1989]|nr:Response regulator [gamma proteobacterium IMCC1989]